MARRRLSDGQMLKGVKRALANSRTPSNFRPGLRRLQQRLERRIEQSKNGRKGWLDQFF